MKTRTVAILTTTVILMAGCTTSALRKNTFNQSKTVADFIADQVLYNLVMYEKYFVDKTNFNGIPSFVKLQTGQAQVQQSINGQLALKLPMKGGDEIDPQLSGTHQTQDNWAFAPVVDPVELNRLYHLYRSQFKKTTTNDLAQIFPYATVPLGSDGRPILSYKPIPDPTNANQVYMISNQPQFTATFTNPPTLRVSDVPGAIAEDGRATNTWFSFSSPTVGDSTVAGWVRTGPYLGKSIWITDRENFFRFTVLVFGQTNNLASAPYAIQNGLFLPLR
jgi:hypothetical protein